MSIRFQGSGTDYLLDLPELTVKVSLQREKKKSNKVNATDSGATDKGITPQTINISFLCQYSEEKELKKIYQIVRSANEDGTAAIWNVTNRTMNVAGITKAEIISFAPEESTSGDKAWNCNMVLIEKASISGRESEQKQPDISESNPPAEGYSLSQTLENIEGQFKETYYMGV